MKTNNLPKEAQEILDMYTDDIAYQMRSLAYDVQFRMTEELNFAKPFTNSNLNDLVARHIDGMKQIVERRDKCSRGARGITSPKTWSVVSGRFDEDGMAIYENVSGGEYFKGLYAQDYAAAQGAVARDNPDNPNARNDPALVKAEMQRKDDKGNPIYHNSADFYHDVIYADGGKYPQRVTETLNIIGKSQVSEVGTKPNTNAQAGQDLREAKVALGGTDGKGGVIQELKTQGGDPELIKSLDALYKELDRLDKQTAADGKAQGKTQDQIDKDFAEAWIESYNKPPAGGGKTNKSNLETSQTIAQNINMDQTQDLKMLLAQLDMIMKAVTSAIKSIDETLRKLSGNLRI